MGGDKSVFAGDINLATIDDVHLSGAAIATRFDGGLLARNITQSVVKNSSVQGQINILDFSDGTGGLAARASSSQFINDQCDVTFAQAQNFPFLDIVHNAGGCVGFSQDSVYTGVSSSGSFSFDDPNLDMMDARSIGGLIGRISGDTVTKSSSSTNLGFLRGSSLGGLIGEARASAISTSFATGTVSSAYGYAVGGLVGRLAGSSISNSYVTGNVGTGQQVGALVGQMTQATLTNTYATGVVTADDASASHGLIGYSESSAIKSSFWKINTTGVASTVESIGEEIPLLSG
jgi:hypothetical protein